MTPETESGETDAEDPDTGETDFGDPDLDGTDLDHTGRDDSGIDDPDSGDSDPGDADADATVVPPGRLTHLDEEGRPRMVDVAEKDTTRRRARAVGSIRMRTDTLDAIREGRTKKGDVLQVAELAGIMAGKRTGELIPLCHVLPATSIEVALRLDEELPGVRCEATAHVAGRTGVEMEALTAVSVALLTVYDMVKAIDRGMTIEAVRLREKEGGRSGRWQAERTE